MIHLPEVGKSLSAWSCFFFKKKMFITVAYVIIRIRKSSSSLCGEVQLSAVPERHSSTVWMVGRNADSKENSLLLMVPYFLC